MRDAASNALERRASGWFAVLGAVVLTMSSGSSIWAGT